uniref:F-BAR domain-containing protein n=1 Tax=Octopus bimaculoides TaxID=37653 RepID=A0A0L8H680_OCTBM
MDILRELFDLAGQHEIIAENTQIQIIKEIQQLVVELKQERKKGLQEGTKVQQSLILSTQQLDKTKKQYERAYREAEKAIEAYKKADADINLSRAEVEKQKNLSISKTQISEECKNDYAAQLEVTNKHQREYYSHLLPNVFQQLQDMDEKRISRLKSFLKSFADQEKRVLPIINTCIEGMFKAVDSISPKEDSRLVIERYKSGFTHPSDLPFEDLSCPTPGDSYPHNSAPRSQSSTDFKNQIKPGTVGGRTKKRGGLFSIFGSSKKDLDAMYKWAEENNMQFNASEFQPLHCQLACAHIGPKRATISESSTVHDLGIDMSNNASFYKDDGNVQVNG